MQILSGQFITIYEKSYATAMEIQSEYTGIHSTLVHGKLPNLSQESCQSTTFKKLQYTKHLDLI